MDSTPSRPRAWGPFVPGWPVYAVLLCYWIWWALGLSGFIWALAAVPMLANLVMRGRVRAPRGFGVWMLFIAWMLASAVKLDTPTRWIGFVYDAGSYVAIGVWFLYVYNLPSDALPMRRLSIVCTIFFVSVVVGGYLGMLFPNFSFASPLERVLPGQLTGDDFVQTLVHPAFAQVQDVLGYEAPRPKAPFLYANEWGGSLALLAPFAVLSWSYLRSRAWRVIVIVALLAAVVPAIGSLDRGLWISAAAAAAYGAVWLAVAGRAKALVALVILLAVAAGVLLLTPLKDTIEQRIANPHSNEGRSYLYEESLALARSSPLLGHGGPRASTINPNLPPVGTQGHLWRVLVSHGYPGALLFCLWFIGLFVRTGRRGPSAAFACHLVLLIGLIQMPIYDGLPSHLFLLALAGAVGLRALHLAQAGRSPGVAATAERPGVLTAR